MPAVDRSYPLFRGAHPASLRDDWRIQFPEAWREAFLDTLQESFSRICAQVSPASSIRISRARRASSARPAWLVARWLSSTRSALERLIVLLMSTITLPFRLLQSTS
jgi:hypothetical protein